jgi:hypothetical protein
MSKETLEEVAERFYPVNSTGGAMEMLSRHQLNNCLKQEGFIECAKWMQERMYSEEDLLSAFEAGMMFIGEDKGSFKEWFEQFKKGRKD